VKLQENTKLRHARKISRFYQTQAVFKYLSETIRQDHSCCAVPIGCLYTPFNTTSAVENFQGLKPQKGNMSDVTFATVE